MGRKIKNKNIIHKCVNNLTTKIYHTNNFFEHTMSKDLDEIYKSLSPMYDELEREYSKVDLMDLIYYERWLNG